MEPILLPENFMSIMAHVIQLYKLKFDQLLIYEHVAPKSLK